MDASILVLCANRHFTGVTVTFYQCLGRFTGFRDGQGVTVIYMYIRNFRTYTFYAFVTSPILPNWIGLKIFVPFLIMNYTFQTTIYLASSCSDQIFYVRPLYKLFDEFFVPGRHIHWTENTWVKLLLNVNTVQNLLESHWPVTSIRSCTLA